MILGAKHIFMHEKVLNILKALQCPLFSLHSENLIIFQNVQFLAAILNSGKTLGYYRQL